MSIDVRALVEERIERREREQQEAVDGVRREQVREATLDFVEGWTGERSLPIAAPGDGYQCVLARAMGGCWNGSDWHPTGNENQEGESDMRVNIPAEVQEFIRRFDAGEYPDLVEAD